MVSSGVGSEFGQSRASLATRSHLRPSTTDIPHHTLPPQLDNTIDDNVNNNNNNNNSPHNTIDDNINNNNNNNNSPHNTINNNINNNNNNNISDIIDNLDTFDISSISNPDINDHAPVKFSTNDKSDKADAEMDHVRQYLLSRRTPPNLSMDALTCFISRANHFLITEGQLWRRQHSS